MCSSTPTIITVGWAALSTAESTVRHHYQPIRLVEYPNSANIHKILYLHNIAQTMYHHYSDNNYAIHRMFQKRVLQILHKFNIYILLPACFRYTSLSVFSDSWKNAEE